MFFGEGMLDRRWIMAAATTRSPKTSLRDFARDEAPFLRYPWGRFLSSSTRRSLFLVTLQFGKFDAQRRGRDRRATRFENIVSPFDSPLLFGPLRARFESYPQRYLTLSDELGPKSVRLWSQRAWYSKPRSTGLPTRAACKPLGPFRPISQSRPARHDRTTGKSQRGRLLPRLPRLPKGQHR